MTEDDVLLQRAAKAVILNQHATTAFLKRRFGIGHTRASALMDTLEAYGVVGPARQTPSREVLVRSEELAQHLATLPHPP